MSVRMKWAAALLLAAALAWLLYEVFAPRPGGERAVTGREGVGSSAPDFVLKDIRGNDVRLSRYRGQVVLLVFMTTWCSYCRADIPYLKDLRARYGPRGLVILSIDIQEPREKAAAYAEKYGLPYATLLDSQGEVMEQYGVRGVPALMLIDRGGQLLCWNCRVLETHLEKQFGSR